MPDPNPKVKHDVPPAVASAAAEKTCPECGKLVPANAPDGRCRWHVKPAKGA